MTSARGLVLASHPGPCVVVTLVSAGLAISLGQPGLRVLEIAAAVLAGQLSVGWSNDAHDALGDQAVPRQDKPTVTGLASPRALWIAAFVALAVCVPLSLRAGGLWGGIAHVAAVASAWSYNLRLKATVLSAVPYAVSFGLLGWFLTLGLQPALAPAPWFVVSLSGLGVAAHLANAIPDIDRDRATGAGGWPAALGAEWASRIAAIVLVAVTGLIVFSVALPLAGVAVLVVAAAATAVAVVRRQRGFEAILCLALINVVAVVLAGGPAITGAG